MSGLTQSYREFHSSEFDDEINYARDFVQTLNPAAIPTPPDQISVIPAELVSSFKATFRTDDASGQFNYPGCSEEDINAGCLFVLDEEDDTLSGKPVSRRVNRLANLAHELTHSITYTSLSSYHRFFAEVLAGCGQLAFIRHLQGAGEFVPTRAKNIFNLDSHDQLTRIFGPAETRLLDARESQGLLSEVANTDTGLMGAATFETVSAVKELKVSGRKLIQLSRPGETKGLNVMKFLLRTLDVDLVDQVQACPQFTSKGNLRAVYLIQNALRKHGQQSNN